MYPNYFFRYAKKHSICQSEVGPFLGPTKALISNKYEICCLLLDQFNSVFTKPNPDMIVTNPFSFFHTQSSMNEDNELYLTNIVLLKLYMNCPPVQQQDQMVFHLHYWSTAPLN